MTNDGTGEMRTLHEIARALEARGVAVDLEFGDGRLLCHSARRHELGGRCGVVVDAVDGSPALELPWAQRRYRVADVATCVDVLAEWLPRHSSTQVEIDEDLVERHGLERVEVVGVGSVASRLLPDGGSTDDTGSVSGFDHRVDGDWSAVDAALASVAEGALLFPRLLAPNVRSALEARRAAGGEAPHRIRVTPAGMSLLGAPRDPWAPAPAYEPEVDAMVRVDRDATVAIVFTGGDVGLSARPTVLPRLLVVDVGRDVDANARRPFIVHAADIGTFVFGPRELAFMIERDTAIVHEPVPGHLVIRRAYPRLTESGLEQLEERGGEPEPALPAFAQLAESIVAGG